MADPTPSPLDEAAAEPGSLDVFFSDNPETYNRADLETLVAAQRAERERRLAAKSRKKVKDGPK